MSGLSSRFSKAGYLSNKYKLDLYGHSVFHHIISQFKHANLNDCFVFIHNGNEFDENFISQTCHDMGLQTEKYSIVKLMGETRGQAETVAKGLEQLSIDSNERLIIYNIDSIRIGFDLPKELDTLDVDGYLEVFQGEGDHWSFALPKDNNLDESFLKVESVAEKQRISDYCSNGLYYFKSFQIFKEAYDIEIERFNGSGELFVAPLYNNIIKTNKSVYMREIPAKATVFCGTPQEYETILSLPVPDGLIPSEEYVANKILILTADNVNQKNYFEVIELLKSVDHIEESEFIFKALNVFFNFYGCYSRIVEYSYTHFSRFGNREEYRDVYIYLEKKVFGFIKNCLNTQFNNQKAVNLMAVLITISGVKALKKHPKEFKEVAIYFSIPDHLKVFRVLRNKISDVVLLKLIFNKSNHNHSVSYLFIIFCLSYRLEDNEHYIKFIEKNIDNSHVLRKGDNERKILLSNVLFNRSKSASFKLSISNILNINKDIRVAVLITGQMRDYHVVSNYFNSLETEGISYDLYLSTWDKSGQPPCHIDSLRGYGSEIRVFIKNRASKFNVSNEDFNNNYHLKSNNLVDENVIKSSFKRLKWLNIDVEGKTTNIFNSNQDRLYFKVNQAYKEASEKNYDAYIRIRPDLNFSLENSILTDCIRECVKNEGLIFVRDAPLTDMYMPFVDDNFAVASPTAMEAYASLYEVSLSGEEKLPLDPSRKDIRPHSSLAYQLFLNKINIKLIKNINNWKYNEVDKISAPEYLEYLNSLDKNKLNKEFIDSLIFKLRAIK